VIDGLRPWCLSLFDSDLDKSRPPLCLRGDHRFYRDWLPARADERR